MSVTVTDDGTLCLDDVIYRPGSTANGYHIIINCENQPKNITNSSVGRWCTKPFYISTVCTVYLYDIVNKTLGSSDPAKIISDIYINVTISPSSIETTSISTPFPPTRMCLCNACIYSYLDVLHAL